MILSNMVKYLSCKILSNNLKYLGFQMKPLPTGCSTDASLRARFLAVALHQDDLPAPTRLLSPHPHPHPPQNNRVKVPPGGIFSA